ncbi:hypothetical protein E2C01_012521 [Portunus trituberculatus]|uniref:Uncharacterized protein n=1 Tax=Portunus trituberculatus TaxID=210409 RepID=A0A5B7DDV9_PORTR|nr:hypothetical protein [Portunus trituberculatus]
MAKSFLTSLASNVSMRVILKGVSGMGMVGLASLGSSCIGKNFGLVTTQRRPNLANPGTQVDGGREGSSEACVISLWTATTINDVRQEPFEFQIIIVINIIIARTRQNQPRGCDAPPPQLPPALPIPSGEHLAHVPTYSLADPREYYAMHGEW